jgi:thiol-disulfide isomerase/thioredoxin
MNLPARLWLLILLGTVACNNTAKQRPASDSYSQISIAKIKLMDLNDQPVDLTKYKDKTIFLNFWATWCKPCREEMPSIQSAMAILKSENIEFFFASDESKGEIEEFKRTNKFNFNYVRTGSLADLNIMGLPTTFIFDADGKLVFSEIGYRKWDDKANIELIQNISKSR